MDPLFRAIADPTRRRILELLRQRERTAGEIAAEFPIAFPSVSRHLAILRSAGLVATRLHFGFDTDVGFDTFDNRPDAHVRPD